jgi:large subunit ribosomal protein L17
MSGYRKLGRTSSQRKAMLRALATQLIYHGKITTTETRAKEVRRIAEKLITLAVKVKDDFTTQNVTVKVPQKDKGILATSSDWAIFLRCIRKLYPARDCKDIR